MNAQINSTNFQQFVSVNKGKLITFLHNDKSLSKFVVDVCGEYFTAKANESDAKIDGFYYLSDCKMVPNKHPLEEIFETHKFTVVLTTGCDIMSEYIEYDNGDFVVKDLRTGHFIKLVQPYFYIKEVWAIVDGKYTKVWEAVKQTVPQTDVDKDVSSDLYHLLKNNNLLGNKTVDIHTKTCVWKDFEFIHISEGIISGPSQGIPTDILINSVIGVTVGGVYYEFKNGKKVSPSIVDKDTSSDLYHLLKNNKTSDIHTKTCVWKDFELNYISGGIIEGYRKGFPAGIHVNSVIGVTVGGVYQEFKNGKTYTKSSDKEPSQVELSDNLSPYIKAQNNALKSCEKVINTINNLNKTLDKVFSNEEPVKLSSEERFNNFKRVYPEILKLDSFLKAIVQEPQFSYYKKTLLTTYESEFNSELWNNFCTSWESVKGAIVKKMPTIRYDPTIQALVKRFSVITHEINPSTDNTEFIGKIDRFISPQGKKIYEKLVNSQPQQLQTPQTPQSSQGGVSIEYRGKAKTVEVINEYTHSNGKNYVLVKDLTDNDKTKTLFKEYIKYL